MIYLAESGSTKTDAVFLNEDGSEVLRTHHMGLNPYFHKSEFIRQKVSENPEVAQYRKKVNKVYFYGAGCSTQNLQEIVKNGLQQVFPNAVVHVDHDLMASAYSTYTGQPAITCILGTGSNSVFFDGQRIQPSMAGLGFILGDEGSASYIGKKLLSSYFYKQMPEKYRKEFEEKYEVNRNHIVKKVYQEPHANVYLSGFAPFASKHIETHFFWEIVFSGFREFLDYHVLYFENARELPVHFVGSIAYHFREVLASAMDHLDLRMGNVVQKPLESLIDYHRQYLLDI